MSSAVSLDGASERYARVSAMPNLYVSRTTTAASIVVRLTGDLVQVFYVALLLTALLI
jgi:hypothetical protein